MEALQQPVATISISTAAPGRRCSTCRVFKDSSQFHKNQNRRDGLCKACKPCAKKAMQDHNDREKERDHKAWTLKHTIAKRELRARKKLAEAAAAAAASQESPAAAPAQSSPDFYFIDEQ